MKLVIAFDCRTVGCDAQFILITFLVPESLKSYSIGDCMHWGRIRTWTWRQKFVFGTRGCILSLPSPFPFAVLLHYRGARPSTASLVTHCCLFYDPKPILSLTFHAISAEVIFSRLLHKVHHFSRNRAVLHMTIRGSDTFSTKVSRWKVRKCST